MDSGELDVEEETIGYRTLAKLYRDGIGVHKDLDTAFDYFMRAAENGDVSSIATVGQCLMYGEGVRKDSKEQVLHILLQREEPNFLSQYWLMKIQLLLQKYYPVQFRTIKKESL